MAIVLKDRVKVSATTTGTGTITLGSAPAGFQNFSVIGTGNTTYYTIALQSGSEFEVGIGTVTDTAGTFTLSRDTVFESSNSGSLVNFSAGTKDVFVTYPAERAVYLNAAGSAVTALDIGTLGASTANITTATITSGTVASAPVNNTDIVNKAYADAIASGIHFHEAVSLATTAALPANTYNNGTSGVGATLTGNANGALSVDSTLTIPAERILVKNEANGSRNGVYVVTQVGSAGTPYILTRATDFDTVGTGVNQIDEGDFFLVTSGVANVNTAWVQQTAPPITIGTTALVFQQFSAPITYTAGTGLSESPSYTFNIANIGTAGTYGSASTVPVFVTNAQGQVTSVTNTAIGISSSAVSGLAASATTNTTDAANITSGTLPVARLNGSYTGVTGTGALAAGSLAAGFTAVSAPLGGTGQTTYTIGDLLYADTTTSLAKLADVVAGNALISGGVGTAPAWGKIGLATHVDGTLPTGNGGTGLTTFTANGVVYASSSSALATGSALQFDGTSLGIGATPTARLSLPNNVNINFAGPITYFDTNSAFSTGADRYVTSAAAARYVQINGSHNWQIAPSGTAGNAISFTQAMTLDTTKLDINNGANSEIRATTSASGYLQLGQFTNGAFVGTSSTDATAGVLRLGTGGTERARIDTLGNLSMAAAGAITSSRINPRVSTAASTATLSPVISSFDQYNLTAQAEALTVAAPTGTPADGNKLIIRILDNGTARAITWNATYTAIGVTLPTTTTASKMLYVGCIYNLTNTRWDVIALTTQA